MAINAKPWVRSFQFHRNRATLSTIMYEKEKDPIPGLAAQRDERRIARIKYNLAPPEERKINFSNNGEQKEKEKKRRKEEKRRY